MIEPSNKQLVTDAITELRKQHARFELESLPGQSEPLFDPANDLLALGRAWLPFFLGWHCADLELFKHALPQRDGITVGEIATDRI